MDNSRFIALAVTLAALTGCAPLERMTVRADVSSQAGGNIIYTNDGQSYGGGHVARVAINLPLIVRRGFTLNTGYEHSSLIDTSKDRGQERVYVGLEFRPFGGGL